MPQLCEASKPGLNQLEVTPCGKDLTPVNCQKCPFWLGITEHCPEGTRGGETLMISAAWRRLKWIHGIPSGDN